MKLPLQEQILSKLRPFEGLPGVANLPLFLTPVVLIFFGILTGTRQFYGNPIHCVVPANFRSGWEVFAENYCWTTAATLQIGPPRISSDEPEPMPSEQPNVYQYVTLVLFIEGIVIYGFGLLIQWLAVQPGTVPV